MHTLECTLGERNSHGLTPAEAVGGVEMREFAFMELLSNGTNRIRLILGSPEDICLAARIRNHISGSTHSESVHDVLAQDSRLRISDWQEETRSGINICLNPDSLCEPQGFTRLMEEFARYHRVPAAFAEILKRGDWETHMQLVEEQIRFSASRQGSLSVQEIREIIAGQCGETITRLLVRSLCEKFTHTPYEGMGIPSGEPNSRILYADPEHHMQFRGSHNVLLHSHNASDEYDIPVVSHDRSLAYVMDATTSRGQLYKKACRSSLFGPVQKAFSEQGSIQMHRGLVYVGDKSVGHIRKMLPPDQFLLQLPLTHVLLSLKDVSEQSHYHPLTYRKAKQRLRKGVSLS